MFNIALLILFYPPTGEHVTPAKFLLINFRPPKIQQCSTEYFQSKLGKQGSFCTFKLLFWVKLWKYEKIYNKMWKLIWISFFVLLAEPGFSKGLSPKDRGSNLLFWPFSRKVHEMEKNWIGSKPCHWCPSPDNFSYFVFRWVPAPWVCWTLVSQTLGPRTHKASSTDSCSDWTVSNHLYTWDCGISCKW